MVICDGFDVKVLCTMGDELPQLQHEGTNYVVAKASGEFVVQVGMLQNENGEWPARLSRVGLWIDGNDCGYWCARRVLCFL